MRKFFTLFLCGNNAFSIKSICDETHGCPKGMMCNFDQQTHGKCIRKSFFHCRTLSRSWFFNRVWSQICKVAIKIQLLSTVWANLVTIKWQLTNASPIVSQKWLDLCRITDHRMLNKHNLTHYADWTRKISIWIGSFHPPVFTRKRHRRVNKLIKHINL